MTEGTPRITFGRALGGALLVLVLVAGTLFWLQWRKSQYYDRLTERIDALVEARRHLPREAVSAVGSAAPVPTGARTHAVMSGVQTEELRHFDQGTLLAIDKLDDGGRVARRDIFDGGRVRVQVFYDEQGAMVRRVDLDEHGREVHAELFVPVGGIRAGY